MHVVPRSSAHTVDTCYMYIQMESQIERNIDQNTDFSSLLVQAAANSKRERKNGMKKYHLDDDADDHDAEQQGVSVWGSFG